VKYPDTATLLNFMLMTATDMCLDEDTITFDAVVEAEIQIENSENGRYDTGKQWFRIPCSVTVEDRITAFECRDIQPYKREPLKKDRKGACDANIVPIIGWKHLDEEATEFLKKYCSEALTTPIPVPIEEIVRKRMKLDLIIGGRLTDNLSIFGQICFSAGKVQLYDSLTAEQKTRDVKRGTIVVDIATYYERNLGCVNNTIAHEAFHWHKHRVYASVRSLTTGEKFIQQRCATKASTAYGSEESKDFTDEERMEWQANHVAPRILMPRSTAEAKIAELYEFYDLTNITDSETKGFVTECIIADLADFYKVSKQAAKIRMSELGFKEADNVLNYDTYEYFSEITIQEAFQQYCDNEDFRSVIDSGLFIYVDGRYVINNEKYVDNADGTLNLTEYASRNLEECCLQFSYRREYRKSLDSVSGLVMYSKTRTKQYNVDKARIAVDNAEELEKYKTDFLSQFKRNSQIKSNFNNYLAGLMDNLHINSETFQERTLLSASQYSKIINDQQETYKFKTVMQICVGIGLSLSNATILLNHAGYTLTSSRTHSAYAYLLSLPINGDIDKCNMFLEILGVPQLVPDTKKGS
jgi:hypothetical protein